MSVLSEIDLMLSSPGASTERVWGTACGPLMCVESTAVEVTLTRFVRALRSTGLPVSPAETLDGFRVLECVGLTDRQLLQDALSLTLAKTPADKGLFADCFDRFFHQLGFQATAKKTLLDQAAPEAVDASLEGLSSDIRELSRAVLHDQHDLPALRLQRAANAVGLDAMATLRDKPHYIRALERALSIDELARYVQDQPGDDSAELRVLRYLRRFLHQEVKDYVDAQYQLNVDASGKQALVNSALQSTLSQLPPDYFQAVDAVVEKLAKTLARQHRRRRRRDRRGQLDIRRMLRDNMAMDGALFNLRWQKQKRERSTVYVICDVSNSVRSIARFLLMFLYRLSDVLPEVRAFAFSNQLGEITDAFKHSSAELAVENAIYDWGGGTTDYGRAMVDLRDAVHERLDNRATLIFLGDARGNYFDPKVDVFREMANRAKQVFWLNPETSDRWADGDSEMARYAPYCFRVQTCSRLRDIERFADRLLASTR